MQKKCAHFKSESLFSCLIFIQDFLTVVPVSRLGKINPNISIYQCIMFLIASQFSYFDMRADYIVTLVVSRSGTIIVQIWYQYGTILGGKLYNFKDVLQLFRVFL